MDDGTFSKDWPHEWIKKIRSRPMKNSLSKRMRQVDLAKRVGVDPRTVQQWENGDRLPSVGNLKRVIQAFWEEGLLLEGSSRQEAEQLWLTVKRFSEARSATHREFPDFDVAWFEALMTVEASSTQPILIPSTDSTAQLNRLPKLHSLFIGRNRAQSEVVIQLHNHPVVSIVGPGGIGKTSLAVEVGSTLSNEYPQGVWLFEFGDITESDELNSLLLSTLGVTIPVNQSDLQVLLDVVSKQKALFIFDNCEHLIDASAVLVESLLAAAPQLSILVTSREPLNISNESVYRIPPLSFPNDEHELHDLTEQDMMEFEAVQLFLERARMVAPQFQPTLSNLRLVVAICKKVEGIPLAIELAVARMNMLTLEQIEERLANLLTLLTAGRRTASSRHQTLKSTIDWSYNLLTSKEQLLLRRLSVFSGGFTLEAAEDICICAPGMPDREDRIERGDMLDLLSGLVNKSLVSNKIEHDYSFVRYYMLESIKEYANGKLKDASEDCKLQALYERHLQYYSHYLVQAEPKFRTREREACIAEVRREYTNLRSALQWSNANPLSRSLGLHMVSNLYWYWLHEGRLQEGLFWLNRFLASHVHNEAGNADYAKALHGQGVILFVQGDIEEAIDSANRSVDLARKLENNSLVASSLRLLAFLHIKLERMQEAEFLVEESVEIARASGDLWNLASSLHAYGKLRLEQNNYVEASSYLEESLQLFDQVRDQWEISGPCEGMGYSSLKLGNTTDSIKYFKKCIAASQIYRGSWLLSRGMEGLAIALCANRIYSEAAIILGAAEKGRQSFEGDRNPNFTTEYQETILTLQQTLGEQELQKWWNKGRDMTRSQALAFSLEI